MAKLLFSLAAAATLSACGGVAHRGDDGSAAGAGPGGASATGGTGGSGAAGAAAAEPTLSFDDAFPWFNGAGSSWSPSEGGVLHMIVDGVPARGTLSTHNHFDPFASTSALHFSARASEPFRLLVSVGRVMPSFDYFAWREGEHPWPEAGVEVDVEWQDFTVPYTDMLPPEPADYASRASFYIAFIVENPAPIEVWLDDVRLR